jgi:cytochrome oxidase Cu insertion factor (SCO1/SenC/PrrC family)
LIYFFARPEGAMSYGELLPTTSLAQTPLKTLAGQATTLASLQGHWLLVVVAPGACDQSCQDRLFTMRQYRLGQGVEAKRLQRVWLINDQSPVAAPAPLIEGVQQFYIEGDVFGTKGSQSIYLLDPQGNQVMRYAQTQDHRKVMNEIGKLLKYNQGHG